MLDDLIRIAREAGAFLAEHYRSIGESDVSYKTGVKDLVTFADKESEKIIFARLGAAFPDHGLIGEESGRTREGAASFIVDPLDGTVNYAQGLPHFAVSIARVEGGIPTHGVVHLPVLDECFAAVRGCGATLNGRPIQVSDKTALDRSFIATGFACVRAGFHPDGVQVFREMIYKVRDLRRLGSAAVDLAYTACGIFDGFYEMGLAPWDVAAGILIVREAGGEVSGFLDDDDPLYGRNILASNGRLHADLKALVETSLREGERR